MLSRLAKYITLHVPQSPVAGGGSGGDIFIHSDNTFTLTGNLYSNGGSSSGQGGGGAGGRIHVYFKTANYYSGYVQAKGILNYIHN